MANTSLLFAASFVALLGSVESAWADPLWFDPEGTLHVEHEGNVITVAKSGFINANGTAVDCSEGIVDQNVGDLSVECVGSGVIKIRDTAGNRLKIVGDLAQLEMSDGQELSITRGGRHSASTISTSEVTVTNEVGAGTASVASGLAGLAQRLGGAGTRIRSGSKEVVLGAGGGLNVQKGGKEVRIGGDGSIFASKPEKTAVISPGWREVRSQRVETADSVTIIKELAGRRTETGIELDISDQVLFDFNSAAIKPKAAAVLAKVAQLIRNESKGRVLIDGHTDSIGSDEYNLKLSAQRAEAVKEWLRDGEQIPEEIMTAKGRGESSPVAPNTASDGSDHPEGRAKNRRVTVVIEN